MTAQEYMLYASSLFSLADDEERIDSVFESLEAIGNALSENPEFITVLDAPNIERSERLAVLDEAFGTLDIYAVNFLKILCEKRSVSGFESCRAYYSKLRDRKNNIEHITVTTAFPLSDELCARLTEKLETERGKHIVPAFKVDKSILGGLVIEGEGSRTDASVLSRLNAIKDRLLSGNKD